MKLGIGPQGSPKQISNELISLCKDLNASGNILDVGSGWGSMLIPMAKALPDWNFFGIERSPTPWFISQLRTAKNNSGNINLFLGDAAKFRYRGYDIIYLNVHKKLLNEITPPLLRNIERGSLVVTYRNQIDGLNAFNTITVKDDRGMNRQVYLYANVAEGEKTSPNNIKVEENSTKPQGEKHIPEPETAPELELEEKPVDEEAAPAPEKAEKAPLKNKKEK